MRRTKSTIAAWAVAAALAGYAAAPALAAPDLAGPAYSPAVGPAVAEVVALAPAHSALVSSVPADGATLSAPPTEIVLTFNENINASFTQVALTRGDAAVALAPVAVKGPEVRAQISAPPLGGGAYRIAFRVVSADGHPISGETRFTVTGPAATTSAAAPTPSVTASATPIPSSAPTSAAPVATDQAAQPAPTGSSRVPGFIIAGVLIAAAVGLVAWDRARR
ncbi:MAG TPA: copper resistance protein CopC [Dermatophilaceae bacterium]|nr:copper resistance protein CopC [Dermatophilaceae bacterium]